MLEISRRYELDATPLICFNDRPASASAHLPRRVARSAGRWALKRCQAINAYRAAPLLRRARRTAIVIFKDCHISRAPASDEAAAKHAISPRDKQHHFENRPRQAVDAAAGRRDYRSDAMSALAQLELRFTPPTVSPSDAGYLLTPLHRAMLPRRPRRIG